MLGQQVFLAKRMAKKRIIAETDAGQHGVATTIVGYSFRFRVCGVYGGTGWMCIVKCPMLSVYGRWASSLSTDSIRISTHYR